MSQPSSYFADLPILQRRDDIVSAVDSNQVTIITAETGAGKSTQVPQYLAEHGYQKVIVTQPRILAARNLCNRVREEWKWRTGEDAQKFVGYRTAHERDDSPETAILYCTDGLQLVREITGIGVGESQVLVLDEVHEWNVNMEVLVAWAKLRCQEDPHFKVVLMSATIEAEQLAEYYQGAAVINVAGRSYPVKKERGGDVIAEIFEQLEKQKNMLVFLPGKAEIEAVAEAVKKRADENNVPVIPLHAQLEAANQQQAFTSYSNGKIILSTNIAQTSITIDDIDTVIDSGLERRSEVRSGVEGLFIGQTSQADCLQRAGRAGRTKAGTYILAPLGDFPCLEFEERDLFPTPEILRTLLDRLALRLANVAIDIQALDFYHSPSKKVIKHAKQKLIHLGALSTHGEVTRIGREMEQFPVESSYARMLVEGKKQPPNIQTKLVAMIAIQEVDGIVKGGTRFNGWRAFTKQTRSDLLAQYDIYLAAPLIDTFEYENLGIIAKNIDKAGEVIERLNKDLSLTDTTLTPIEEGEIDALLFCVVAGQIDNIWSVEPSGMATHLVTKNQRQFSSSSVVRDAKIIAATPFDLQVPAQKGGFETLHLVQDVTKVEPEWLAELAPHVFTVQQSKVVFDPEKGVLATRPLLKFKKQTIEGESIPITEHTSHNQQLFSKLYAHFLYERLKNELNLFHKKQRHQLQLNLPSQQQMHKKVHTMLNGAVSLSELTRYGRSQLRKLGEIRSYLDEDALEQADQKHHGHHRSRRWRPRHRRRRHN